MIRHPTSQIYAPRSKKELLWMSFLSRFGVISLRRNRGRVLFRICRIQCSSSTQLAGFFFCSCYTMFGIHFILQVWKFLQRTVLNIGEHYHAYSENPFTVSEYSYLCRKTHSLPVVVNLSKVTFRLLVQQEHIGGSFSVRLRWFTLPLNSK